MRYTNPRLLYLLTYLLNYLCIYLFIYLYGAPESSFLIFVFLILFQTNSQSSLCSFDSVLRWQ